MTKTPEQLIEELSRELKRIDDSYANIRSVEGAIDRLEEALHVSIGVIGQLARMIADKK